MNKNNSCPKSGIKIHKSDNDCTQNNNMSSLDLNIDNYSIDDLYKLFSIKTLDEAAMKESKKIVLKMHPDKSRLDQKYFLFFSSAYKRLYGIYEFQNKSGRKTVSTVDYDNTENGKVLTDLVMQFP